MQSIRFWTCLIVSFVIVVSVIGVPARCSAQWVPNPGEGSVSVGYQFTKIGDHLFSQSVEGLYDPTTGYAGGPDNHWYMGDIYGRTVSLAASGGIWRGLALSGGVAYLTSKYAGKFPEAPEDDGHFHGGMQDATLALEYMVTWKETAITPMVGTRFPTRNYSTLGHVSVGKSLREYPVGLSLGRSLDPLLPRAYLTAAFSYNFVENHHEHSLDQRHFDFGAGYIISEKISVGASLQKLNTIDGLDWYESDLSGEQEWHDHDASAKSKYVRAGGYASFSVARDLAVRISYTGTLSGENSHAGQSITIAPAWNFRTPFAH